MSIRTFKLDLTDEQVDILDDICRDTANREACSNGELDPTRLIEMLLADVCMMRTRPGCWEAANMAQVFVSHGYDP